MTHLLYLLSGASPLTWSDLDQWLFAQEEEVAAIYDQIVSGPLTPPEAESADYEQLREFVERHS